MKVDRAHEDAKAVEALFGDSAWMWFAYFFEGADGLRPNGLDDPGAVADTDRHGNRPVIYINYPGEMSEVSYQPASRSNHIFEVVVDGRSVGIAWSAGAAWHASDVSMSDRRISAPSRDDAVALLLRRLEGANS